MYKTEKKFYKSRIPWSPGLPIWERGETGGKGNVNATFSASQTIKILKNLSGTVRNFSGCFVFNAKNAKNSKQGIGQGKYFAEKVSYNLKKTISLLGMTGAMILIAPSCNSVSPDECPPKPAPEPKFITKNNQNCVLDKSVADGKSHSKFTPTICYLRNVRAINKQK